MDIQVVDSLVNPDASVKQGYTFEKNGTYYYKVFIYLEGRDVPYIERVRYTLHSSFKKPNYDIWREFRNQNFCFSFWSWGTFTVKVGMQFKDGTIVRLLHPLKFADEINNITLAKIKSPNENKANAS